MLDKISIKMMIELSHDGSLTNVELAKRLGINVLTAGKRKRKLIADGIITINAVTNPRKIGYETHAIFGLEVDQKHIDGICNELTHILGNSLVITCFGRFDVIFIASFVNLKALQSFVKLELSHITGINRFNIYFIGISDSVTEPVQLDGIDRAIISKIVENGQVTHAELATKLGINQSTVTRRISSLIEKDIINFHAFFDPSKLGYTANAFVFVKADITRVDKICSEIIGFPGVNQIFRLMNDYEMVVEINSRNLDELYELISTKIVNVDGVIKTETFIKGFFHHFKSASLFLPPFE